MEYYDAYGEFRGFETPRWNADSEVHFPASFWVLGFME